MTPQFLRSEAARLREMAEGVTNREASRQRLLAMAVDYEARAEQAEKLQPPEQMRAVDPEPPSDSDDVTEPEPGGTGRSRSTRLRLSRATDASTAPGKLGL
jgi:hypothetical protein